jgi:hypothetical protein
VKLYKAFLTAFLVLPSTFMVALVVYVTFTVGCNEDTRVEVRGTRCICGPEPCDEYSATVQFEDAAGQSRAFPFEAYCYTEPPRCIYDVAVRDGGEVSHFYTMDIPKKDDNGFLVAIDVFGPTVRLLDHDSVRVTPISMVVSMDEEARDTYRAWAIWHGVRMRCPGYHP